MSFLAAFSLHDALRDAGGARPSSVPRSLSLPPPPVPPPPQTRVREPEQSRIVVVEDTDSDEESVYVGEYAVNVDDPAGMKIREKPRGSILTLEVLPPKHDALYYPVEIRESMLLHRIGVFGQRGLFAIRRIRSGEFLAEYTGTMIHPSERDTNRVMNDYIGFTQVAADLLLDGSLDVYRYQDGREVAAWGRYVNAANNIGVQNAKMVWEFERIQVGVRTVKGVQKPRYDPDREGVRVMVRATQDIEAGAEILVRYGAGYGFK